MLLYRFDPVTGKYTGSHEAKLDEWQTEIAGRECYFGEANAVWDEPPAQEGYTAYMVNGEWQLVADPTLDELKVEKLAELKAERDAREVEPIDYCGKPYDYDEKARDRINAAIIALEVVGGSAELAWTCADNTDATVTAADLRGIIAAVAVRSNALHVAYRNAKTKVDAAETAEELAAIVL